MAPGPGGDPQPEVEVGRPDVEADRVRRRVGGPPDDEGELGERLGVFLSNPRLQGLPAVLETAGPENRGPDANEVRKTKELCARWLA